MAKRVCSVKNFPSMYPGAEFTESSIRWLIANKKTNGFSSCIVRVGKKILIDLDKFEGWLDAGGDNNKTAAND